MEERYYDSQKGFWPQEEGWSFRIAVIGLSITNISPQCAEFNSEN